MFLHSAECGDERTNFSADEGRHHSAGVGQSWCNSIPPYSLPVASQEPRINLTWGKPIRFSVFSLKYQRSVLLVCFAMWSEWLCTSNWSIISLKYYPMWDKSTVYSPQNPQHVSYITQYGRGVCCLPISRLLLLWAC